MAKARATKATAEREVEVYIPLTRMNFVAFVDAGLFAAPIFLKSRQRYDDVLCLAENVLVGFETPIHDCDGWVDSDEVINFPVIAQVSIPSSWIISADVRTENKSKARRRPNVSPFAIRKIVPVERLVQVIVPGQITAQLLQEDPFLENVSIKIVPKPEVDHAALALVIPSVDANGASCGDRRLEHELRCIAALATCATVAEATEWQDQWTRFSAVEPFLASGLQFLATRTVSTTHTLESWVPAGDRFFSDILDSSTDAEILNRHLQEVPSASLRELDEGVTVALGRIVMDEGMSGGSIETSIGRLRDLLRNCSSERPAYASAIDRIERGLELAEQVATGVRSPEDMFNPKTEWAHSVRTCGMLLLRSDVQGVATWAAAEKPRGALIQDLFLACILTGLYVGFTRLPRSVKGKFGSLLYSIGGQLDGSAEEHRELASSADERGRWRLAYSVSQGSSGIHLSMSADAASLWASLHARFSQRCQHTLRDLVVYRLADIQIHEGTAIAATISCDDGRVRIHFDADSVIEHAQKTHSVQCLHEAATAFDGEFGLGTSEVLPALITAAGRVLQYADLLVKKPSKSSFADGIASAYAQQDTRVFGDYDRLCRAIRISRILTLSPNKLPSDVASSATTLLESPISEWF